MNKLFKHKILNAWQLTRKSSSHPLFCNMDQGDVAFVYNSETGRHLSHFKPDWYFYLEKTETTLNLLKLGKTKYLVGEKWIKVFIKNEEYKSANVQMLVKSLEALGIKTYEADVGPIKRICLDNDVQIEDFDKIRVLYIDIETDDTISGIEVGRDQILSFAAVDQTGKEYYITNIDECKLLQDVDSLLCKYDMIVGWNSYKFDLPYLKARYKKHGIATDYLYNMLHEDMMKRVYYFYSKEPVARQEISSYSLESIAQYFLKEGKVKHSEKIIELFKNQPDKLKEYNIRDARLLYVLEKKLGTVGHTYRLFQMCQTFAQNWSMVKSIDNFILSDGNKKGIHFKTNMNAFKDYEDDTEIDVKYLGGLVIAPKPGYYKDVYDLDFRSLYPNIIRTFNISPECLISKKDVVTAAITTPTIEIEGKKHGGHSFTTKEGIVPSKIGILLDERMKLKKTLKDMDSDSLEYKNTFAKQWVTKDLANSFYGVLGNQYFREFSTDLAEAITVTGQFLLTWVYDYLNKTGRTSIYGDTDSVFAQFKKNDKIEDVLKEINAAMTEMLMRDCGVIKSTLEVGFDCKFDQFIIESKKKYTGIVDGKLRTRGMELVKRDTITLAVFAQKILLDQIFTGKTIKFIENSIKLLKQSILNDTYKIEDITFKKRISKDPKSYKSLPLHVRLAQQNGMGSGDILHYIITDGSKKLEGILADDFTGTFDRNYYWNVGVYPMLERILTVVFPKVDWTKYYIVHEKTTINKKSKKRSLAIVQ